MRPKDFQRRTRRLALSNATKTGEESEGMTHLSLFSGIGGIDLAAEWAGFRTVAFVEQNKFCQKVLAKHWPEVPIYDDIKTFDAKPFRGVDLVTGGFPCQDISAAGKQAGLTGERSGLWYDMLLFITLARPAWVVVENVANLYSIGIDTVLNGLEAVGYSARPIGLEAAHVGAPFKGLRVFIVACSASEERQKISSTINEMEGGRPQFYIMEDVLKWWEASPCYPPISGMANGISQRLDRSRIAALGNAVVPQQVFPILEAIASLV